MTDFTPENLTDDQIITLLQMLFVNMNNLDKVYYDMFINDVPMDITLERYDENGTLQTFILPNRAKDRVQILTGIGSPEGIVLANTGSLYVDLRGRDLYYKTTSSSMNGWTKILAQINFREGIEYVSPSGDGRNIQHLNASNVDGGILAPTYGGTGATGISGLIKGNGSLNPCTAAVPDIDYATPTSYVGMISFFATTVAPTGWLIADGRAVSRTDYARLFQAIGTTWGVGDGSTTFNVPDLVGRFAEGSTASVGQYKAAGIPNLKGDCYVTGNVGPTSATGPFYFEGSYAGEIPDDHRFGIPLLKFDASRVNSVYSNSATTVQPASARLLPCIKI